MKFTKTITLALFASLVFAGGALAVHVLPPSSPPRCVDGACYPKYQTWGHYEGRWRRWPGEQPQPTPSVVEPIPAGREGMELKPFEAPSAEDEDRRAPPPTKKEEDQDSAIGGPDSIEGDFQLPTLPERTLPPLGNPDPPPTLPFGPSSFDKPSGRSPMRKPTESNPHLHHHLQWQPKRKLPNANANADPPPPLPLTFQGHKPRFQASGPRLHASGPISEQDSALDTEVAPANAIISDQNWYRVEQSLYSKP